MGNQLDHIPIEQLKEEIPQNRNLQNGNSNSNNEPKVIKQKIPKQQVQENREKVLQDQIQSISISADRNSNAKLIADLKQVLDICHSKSKIEITLTDLDPTLIKQLMVLKNGYLQTDLKFKTSLRAKESINQQLPTEENNQIDEITEKQHLQRIYQIQEQVENQVPSNFRFILLHWKIMPQLIVDSQKMDLQIKINPSNSQYQVEGKDQIKATTFFRKMKDDLSSTVILLQQYKSHVEAKTIASILNQTHTLNNLQNLLNQRMLIVDSTTHINLENFKNASSLNDQVLYLKTRQATVFVIIQNHKQQNSIKELQIRFTKFIMDPKHVKKLTDSSKFYITHLPNLIQIKKEIEPLKNEGCEIDISEPNMDYYTNKYLIEVTYTLWFDGNMQIVNGQQMMNMIKTQIFDIFNPIISITLKDLDKIEIWQDYLNSQYEKNQEKVIIKTIRNPDKNEIEIKLSGYVGKCISMQEQIQQELKEIESKVIALQYIRNPSTFNRLIKNKFDLFRKQLDLIQQQHSDLRIKIIAVNQELNEIQFKVQFKSNLKYDQVKQLLQTEFLQTIQFYSVDLDFQKFLQYLEIEANNFEEAYATIAGKIDDKVTFLSTKQFLEPVKDLIKQFQLATQQKHKTVILKFDSNLLYQSLQQMILSNTFTLLEDVKCNFLGNNIQLVGPEESLLFTQQMILKQQQQLKSKLISKTLDLNEKEANFFIKKIKPTKLEQYHKQFECEIKVNLDKMSYKNCIASTLSYEGRELNIAYAEISKFQCEAIVNSCNNIMSFGDVNMLSGVAKKIFDMAGADYTRFCEKYIQKHQKLEFGKAITYKMPNLNNGIQNYIINVSTPIYQSGAQTMQDLLIIEQNIKAIFMEANQKNIKTLALPIFGGGACGYSFQFIVQTVLNQIINNLYSQQNQIVQIVYVLELTESKLIQICQVLKTILQPQEKVRQVKYQWQWAKGNEFQNYDDEEINRQIDEGYEQFQNQGSKFELKLVFPYTKQPGTHSVNLQTMIVQDIDLNNTIQLKLKTIQGSQRFLFGNQQIDDVLNEYLMLQKLNNNLEFQIFYKQHKIVFDHNGSIKQLNEATGFCREVRAKRLFKQKNEQNLNQNILIGKNVKLEQKTYDQFQNKQSSYEIVVESFDHQVINNLQAIIEAEILNNTIDLSIPLPLIKDEDFNHLKAFINKNSIKSYQNLENGKDLKIKIFKGKEQKIQAQIDKVISDRNKYPQNWIQQDKNFIKVDLPSYSQEYQQIQQEFKKTEEGCISKIYRLQNQRLWANYQSELLKLQDVSLKSNSPLTQLEQERFLWHGVSGQHPKQIYESMKEAFDITYSKQGMWGQGIYFAENSQYSRDYSYKLTRDDDPLHANKLVFLCCKVATGKVHICNANNTIKRPPDGYDCVSGYTNGSNIFILYGMDVRRAYPAYEIIYQ